MTQDLPKYTIENATPANETVSSKIMEPEHSRTNYDMEAVSRRIMAHKPYLNLVKFDPIRQNEYVQTFFAAAVYNRWTVKLLKRKFDCLFEDFYRSLDKLDTEASDGEYRLKQIFYNTEQKRPYWLLSFLDNLEQLEFKPLNTWPSIFCRKTGCVDTYLLLLVDDIYIASPSRGMVDAIAAEIDCKLKKEIPEFNKPKMTPKLETSKLALSLNNESFINRMLNDFNKNVKQAQFKYDDPMLPIHFKIAMGDPVASDMRKLFVGSKDLVLYRRTINGLRYLACHTRPDIALVTEILHHGSREVLKLHWHMLIQVLHYLHGTKDLNFEVKLTEKPRIAVYYDVYFNYEDYGFQTLGFCAIYGTSFLKWSVDVRDPVSSPRAEYLYPDKKLETLKLVIEKIKDLKPLLSQLVLPSTASCVLYTSDKDVLDTEQTQGDRKLLWNFAKTEKFVIKYVNHANNIARMFSRPLWAHQLRAKPFAKFLPGLQDREEKSDLTKLFS